MDEKTRLLRRKKIQSIMLIWKDNSQIWIQSAELRRKLVLRFNKEWIYNEGRGDWVNLTTKERCDKKPLPYVADGELYGDLKSLVEAGILENKQIPQEKGKDESYYRPTKKYWLEPIKLHFASLIKDRGVNHIYYGLDYLLLLPKNLTTNEFLKDMGENVVDMERAALLEKTVFRFLHSIKLILMDAKLRKAKRIWQKKINDNNGIYSPLKLHLHVSLLVSLIIEHSQVFLKAIVNNMASELEAEIKSRKELLEEMIFRDVSKCLGYYPVDIEKMNDGIQSSFKKNCKHINRVWKEIHETLGDKDFGIILSPTAFLNLNPTPDFSKGFEHLLERKEQAGLIEVKTLGEKKIVSTTVDNHPLKRLPIDVYPDEIEDMGIETGKRWFNNRFGTDTKDELKKLCMDLGYSDKGMYRMLGWFIFPLPYIPHKSNL